MRAKLQASVATESMRTATEILTLVCDAVVLLDDDSRVKGSSPALEAPLFTNASKRRTGADFGALVFDGDCDRCGAFMGDHSRAQCLHMHCEMLAAGLHSATALLSFLPRPETRPKNFSNVACVSSWCHGKDPEVTCAIDIYHRLFLTHLMVSTFPNFRKSH